MLCGAPGSWADSPEGRGNINLILWYYTNHRNRKESLLCIQNFTYLNGQGPNCPGGRCEKLFPRVTSCPQMWKPRDKHTMHGMIWMRPPPFPTPVQARSGHAGGRRVVAFCTTVWAGPGLCCHRDHAVTSSPSPSVTPRSASIHPPHRKASTIIQEPSLL